MIKAFIFDLDGTLTDTIESITCSVGETLKEMGLSPISEEQCKSFVGNGAVYLLDKSIRAAGNEDGSRLDEAMEIYKHIFDEKCTYHVTTYEGLMPVLEELKRRGIKLAVLSNKPHRQTVKVAQEIFGHKLFNTVQGQQEGIPRKPAPEGLYAILEKLDIAEDECLYAGDSEVDIVTGSNAGVRTVGVAWGYRTESQIKEAGAEIIIQKPEELLELL